MFITELQAIFQCFYPKLNTTKLSYPFRLTIHHPSHFQKRFYPCPHPRIQLICRFLLYTSKKITLIRIPSHIGITGNKAVDVATQHATYNRQIQPKLLPSKSDLTQFIRLLVSKCWTEQWQYQIQLGNKLAQIKNVPIPWPSSDQAGRREEIILIRIRIEHIRVTLATSATYYPSAAPTVSKIT